MRAARRRPRGSTLHSYEWHVTAGFSALPRIPIKLYRTRATKKGARKRGIDYGLDYKNAKTI